MNYLSVCSGIEAATQAWHPIGWHPVAFSEIDKFPAAVLAHHYPDVPNWGDMTNFKEWPDATVDVLVGGTPCQSFSVAGLRKGLADPRGNLALTYLAIAERYRPQWLVWENVPGVLSADGGRAFGAIIGGMVELGYCPAWRVLDAQYVRTREFPGAVPQRRRRVFVVAHFGDWRRAAAVLFDRESLSGNPAPGREAGEGTTHSVAPCIGASGRGFERAGETRGQDPVVAHVREVAPAMTGNYAKQPDNSDTSFGPNLVAHTLKGDGFDVSEDGTGRGTPLVPCLSSGQANAELCDNLSPALNCNRDGAPIVLGFSNVSDGSSARNADNVADPITCRHGDPGMVAFSCKDHGADAGQTAPTLRAMNHSGSHANAGGQVAVAFQERGRSDGPELEVGGEVACALTAPNGGGRAQERNILTPSMAVRRLTPVECERLQGFPDDFTRIPWRNKPADQCPDGPRYKALGNSMAVNVMSWIGQRIAGVTP